MCEVDRVFLEQANEQDYLAMFVNGVDELNVNFSPEAESLVLGAFPDLDPSSVLGAQVVDYEPPKTIRRRHKKTSSDDIGQQLLAVE